MSESAPARPSVLDATVLSNFAYLDQVRRLEVLPRPVAPPAVQDEIRHGADTHLFLKNAVSELGDTIPVARPDENWTALCDELRETLDRGEAQALAVAIRRDGQLVTDDSSARDVARQRGVTFTGTIGVLVELVDSGGINESTGGEWLRRLVDEAGYRAPSRNLCDYL